MSEGYNGNPRLRRAFVSLPITQSQLDEYKKCADDPVYFAQRYMKIVHPDKGLIPFSLWDFQKDMITNFHKNRFNIVCCPRQVGKSLCSVAFILHHILFNPFKRVALLANKGKNANDLLAKLQLAYEHLPLWIQQGIITWNKGDIELENGSIVVAAATSASSVRSGTYSIVFLDEYAFVPPNIADEFFRSTYPTISSGKETKIIMVSTPNGMNHFYKEWVKAEQKTSSFVPFQIHWSFVPGRDEAWKQETINNTSPEQFEQEYGCVDPSTIITVRNIKTGEVMHMTIEYFYNQL